LRELFKAERREATRRSLSPRWLLAQCRSRGVFQHVSKATGHVACWCICPPWGWRSLALQCLTEMGRRIALIFACDCRGGGLTLQQGVDEALVDLCPGLLCLRRPGGALIPSGGLCKDLDLL
jgi:hypothetical protein